MAFSKHNTHYQSDITLFISELKAKNPGIEAGQRAGRAIHWDKEPIDLDARRRAEQSRVQQQPYVYQNKG